MSAPSPTPRKTASASRDISRELLAAPIFRPSRSSTPSSVSAPPRPARVRAPAGKARSRSGRARRSPRARRRPSRRSRAQRARRRRRARPGRRRSRRPGARSAGARERIAPLLEAPVRRVALERADRDRLAPPSCRARRLPRRAPRPGRRARTSPPSMFSAKIVSAAGAGSPSAISAMKRGTSTPAGHATVQGAGAYGPPHSRQRSASSTASVRPSGGRSSVNSGSGAVVAVMEPVSAQVSRLPSAPGRRAHAGKCGSAKLRLRFVRRRRNRRSVGPVGSKRRRAPLGPSDRGAPSRGQALFGRPCRTGCRAD